MTAPLPPTTASDAELVASKLWARAESFGRLHGNYLYYGVGDSLADKEAAALIDKLSAEVAAKTQENERLRQEKDVWRIEAEDLRGLDANAEWTRLDKILSEEFEKREAAEAEATGLRRVLNSRVSARHEELMAEALAEIKASVDGHSDQPVRDIVYGLIAEIDSLPPRASLSPRMEADNAG